MLTIESVIGHDRSAPPTCISDAALAPRRRRGASTAWLMLGGYTVGALDMLAAIAYWALHGVAPERILQSVLAWFVGASAFAGGLGTAALGAALYGLLMWGVIALYYALARKHPLLWRRPLLCGGIYGALAYLAIFQLFVPLMTGSRGVHDVTWIATCVIVYTTFVGMPCALFARAAARA